GEGKCGKSVLRFSRRSSVTASSTDRPDATVPVRGQRARVAPSAVVMCVNEVIKRPRLALVGKGQAANGCEKSLRLWPVLCQWPVRQNNGHCAWHTKSHSERTRQVCRVLPQILRS